MRRFLPAPPRRPRLRPPCGTVRRSRSAPAAGLLLLLALLGPTLVTAADAPELGTVTYIQGEVTLQRGDQRRPLQVDERLRAGDVVSTGPGAKARIVFCGGPLQGTRLVPPASRLDLGELLRAPPDRQALTAVAGEVLAAMARAEADREANCGKRLALDDPWLLCPLPCKWLNWRREVDWLPVPGAETYRVVVRDDEDHELRRESFPASVTAAPDLLPASAGSGLSITVEALAAGRVLAQATAELLAPDPADEPARRATIASLSALAALTADDAADPTPLLLQGELCYAAGYCGEAWLCWRDYGRAVGPRPGLLCRLRNALIAGGLQGNLPNPLDAKAVFAP